MPRYRKRDWEAERKRAKEKQEAINCIFIIGYGLGVASIFLFNLDYWWFLWYFLIIGLPLAALEDGGPDCGW